MLKKKYLITALIIIGFFVVGLVIIQLTTKDQPGGSSTTTKKVQPKPGPGYDPELSSKAPPSNPNSKIPAASQAQTGAQPQPTQSAPKN